MLLYKVNIFNINLIYRQLVIKGDVPIIKNMDMSKKVEEKHFQLKNNLTNDTTNIGQTYAKVKNFKTDEENNNNEKKNNSAINNHEEIIIRSNKYNTTNSIIEVKLPNPYLDTECVKQKRYIDYNINSKYKSKFADYINSKHHLEHTGEIRPNKTHKITKKFDNYIYFTKLTNT